MLASGKERAWQAEWHLVRSQTGMVRGSDNGWLLDLAATYGPEVQAAFQLSGNATREYLAEGLVTSLGRVDWSQMEGGAINGQRLNRTSVKVQQRSTKPDKTTYCGKTKKAGERKTQRKRRLLSSTRQSPSAVLGTKKAGLAGNRTQATCNCIPKQVSYL